MSGRFGFAPAEDRPIPYLDRIRRYYETLGYGKPYEWAHYVETPFAALGETAGGGARGADYHRRALPAGQGRPGAGCALQRGGEVLQRLFRRQRIGPGPAHLPYRHRPRPHRGRGYRKLVPAPRAPRRRREGRIGEVAPRFHGAPTNRSHAATIEVDAPELLARCREDGADAAVLAAN